MKLPPIPEDLLRQIMQGESSPRIGDKWTHNNATGLASNHYKDLPIPLLRNLWNDFLPHCKADTYSCGLEPFGCEPIFSVNLKVPLRYAVLNDEATFHLIRELVYNTPDETKADLWCMQNTLQIAKAAVRTFTPPQVRAVWEEVKDMFPINELTTKCMYTLNEDGEHDGDDPPYHPEKNPVHPYGSWATVLGHACIDREEMWDKYKYLLVEQEDKPVIVPNGSE